MCRQNDGIQYGAMNLLFCFAELQAFSMTLKRPFQFVLQQFLAFKDEEFFFQISMNHQIYLIFLNQ